MKKRISFIIYFLFVTFNLLGQDELRYATLDKEYKDNKSTLDEFEKHYFKLVDLKSSNFKLHVRLLMDNRKVIDLFSDDNVNFDGQLLNYATQYDKIKDSEGETDFSNKSDIPNKYVYEIIQLDKITANKIGKRIQDIHLMEINKIEETCQWACGKMYFIFKSDSTVSEKCFVCPLYRELMDFYNFIEYDSGMMDKFYDFTDKFEKGKFYTYDSITTYISSDNELNKWKKEEFIAVAHIGASNKPLRPIIISKDSVSDFFAIDFRDGKSHYEGNARNYIVDRLTYNKLKSLVKKYKKSIAFDNKEYEFYIYAKDNPNHTYFLTYKESMKLLKLLIETSKTEPNNTHIIDAFEGAIEYYKNFY